MRAELVAITGQVVSVRGQIILQKAALREMLAGLNKKNANERVAEQEFFFKYAHVSDEAIKQLEQELAELEKLRQVKMQEILKVRKFRKGLEKLRARAKEEFIKEQNKQEQKELDEKTTTSFAKNHSACVIKAVPVRYKTFNRRR